jgi:hypothetical protein
VKDVVVREVGAQRDVVFSGNRLVTYPN